MSGKNNSLDEEKIRIQFLKIISLSTDHYINKILKKNKKFDFNKPVILFGAAKMGVIFTDLCKRNKIKILSFCDNNKFIQGSLIKNIKVESIDILKKRYTKDTQIIITSLYDDEIKEQLNKLGFGSVWSHTFFSTVYANKFSILAWTNNINFIISNKDKLLKCFDMLSDKESKSVFLNIIKYRLSLNRKYLKAVLNNVDNIYFDDNIYKMSENEVFVDGGAFNGDTVDLFIDKINNKFKGIYCFEPDEKSYLDLRNFIKNKKDKRIKTFKYGLGSKAKTVYFTNDGDLGSKVSDDGRKINIVTIDSLIKEKITLLKLDIEGFEKEALLGARDTMLKNKSKLAICVYHNLSDLWEIPLLIKKVNPDYKIYLRHYNQFLFNTICYAI